MIQGETNLEPGRVYRFTIEVHPASYVFKAGHRIAFVVADTGSGMPPETIEAYLGASHTAH